MQIDPRRLNIVHNDLKTLAGERDGAFILFVTNGDGDGRDVQIRFVGTDLALVGLLESCVPYLREQLSKKFKENMVRKPSEPD